ncbi:glycosyltransferase family 39 protein [bacterium]|nr:glycosyltransferase family 39 protein [bacterium]
MAVSRDKKELLYIGLFCLFVAGLWLLFYLPYIKQQILGIDTAAYIIGAQKILSGGVLYNDFIDNKPPLIFFLFALVLKIFGRENFIALNCITLCALISISFCIAIILSHLKVPWFQRVVIVCMHIVLHNVLLSHSAVEPNTEIFMTLFALLGVYLSLRRTAERKWGWVVASGMSFGIAVGFKQPAVFMIIVVLTSFLLYGTDFKWGYIFKQSLCFCAGFFAVWSILCIYFFSYGVGFRFLFICFGFSFVYGSTMSFGTILIRYAVMMIKFIKTYPFLFGIYCFSLLSSVYFLARKDIPKNVWKIIALFFLWHILDTGAVMLGGLFFLHYFVQWIPSFVMITSIPFFLFGERLSSINRKKVMAIMTGYLCIVMMYMASIRCRSGIINYTPPVSVYKDYRNYYEQYGSSFYAYPASMWMSWFNMISELVQYTQHYVLPDQTLLVWGFRPELYLMCRRQPATRFIHTGMITGDFLFMKNIYESSPAKGEATRKEFERMLFDDLHTKPPHMVIVEDTKRSPDSKPFWDYIALNFTKVYLNPQLPYELYVLKPERDKT